MRDAGGQLPDRGKLLGPQHFMLMPLHPLGNLFHALHDTLQLLVEMGQVPARRHTDGGHVLIETLGDVLHAHAELVDRSTQAAGNAIAAENAADWTAHTKQQHNQARLAADLVALPKSLVHALAAGFRQFMAKFHDVVDGMALIQDVKIHRLARAPHIFA